MTGSTHRSRCAHRAAAFSCPPARTAAPRPPPEGIRSYRIIMAKNQPHPSDPAKRQAPARATEPAPASPPAAPAALRGQGLAGL
ncbi:hypothetical protein RZV19_24380, partial [Burkholderia pseudomallei]|nr:hypothetical protein [Burkholderia pseudomallei]MDV2173641.1 hypothetical protein [Burkholderia pseudomallei]MDV2188106.1 hypothetical protein [Burkholderia pseudomallei]